MSEPAGLNPRSTTRGRPRTTGTDVCVRCGRSAAKVRARWPEGKVCGPCFTVATRTRGTCPGCGQDRLLPGPPTLEGGPRCGECAGIPHDFHCTQCGTEGESYRRAICARCALRNDLTAMLLADPAEPAAMARLVDILCEADRPESIITWKRSPKVQALLTSLAAGTTPLTHEGLDTGIETAGGAVNHLRALLVHHSLLPYQDPYLARFEAWIEDKLRPLAPEVARPLEHFAKWHHLKRIRSTATPDIPARGPVQSAKQEITETAKFLQWLWDAHRRTAATCTQQDVDEWRANGPTTRKLIQTFFSFARSTRLNMGVDVGRYTARTRPTLAQDQRLAWLRELLTGTSESRPYRVAGTLLLLYAQPLVRVAALRTDAISVDPATGQTAITFADHAVPVPGPFAELLLEHLDARPNLRTGVSESPWLFPGTLAGRHLHPTGIMDRLRSLGIHPKSGRNRALDELVSQMPPPLVADALGYSYQAVFKHADSAGESWGRYAGLHRQPAN